jgi:hypothetical protein
MFPTAIAKRLKWLHSYRFEFFFVFVRKMVNNKYKNEKKSPSSLGLGKTK